MSKPYENGSGDITDSVVQVYFPNGAVGSRYVDHIDSDGIVYPKTEVDEIAQLCVDGKFIIVKV